MLENLIEVITTLIPAFMLAALIDLVFSIFEQTFEIQCFRMKTSNKCNFRRSIGVKVYLLTTRTHKIAFVIVTSLSESKISNVTMQHTHPVEALVCDDIFAFSFCNMCRKYIFFSQITPPNFKADVLYLNRSLLYEMGNGGYSKKLLSVCSYRNKISKSSRDY